MSKWGDHMRVWPHRMRAHHREEGGEEKSRMQTDNKGDRRSHRGVDSTQQRRDDALESAVPRPGGLPERRGRSILQSWDIAGSEEDRNKSKATAKDRTDRGRWTREMVNKMKGEEKDKMISSRTKDGRPRIRAAAIPRVPGRVSRMGRRRMGRKTMAGGGGREVMAIGKQMMLTE